MNQIMIEPVLDCDLRCHYCFTNYGLHGSMAKEDVLGFVRRYAQATELKTIFWIGRGEVCLWEPWPEVMNTILDELPHVEHDIQTNGMKLIGCLDKIKAYDKLQINISIDGLKEHHELNRGPGTFDVMHRTLVYLAERKISTIIRYLMTPTSVLDGRKFMRWAREIDPAFRFVFNSPVAHATPTKLAGGFRQPPPFPEYDMSEFLVLSADLHSFSDGCEPPERMPYMALHTEGVFTCAFCRHKIGEVDTPISELFLKLKACEHCEHIATGQCLFNAGESKMPAHIRELLLLKGMKK